MVQDDDLEDLIGKPPAVVPEVLPALKLNTDQRGNTPDWGDKRGGQFVPGGKGGPGRPKGSVQPVVVLSRAEMQKIGMLLLVKDYTTIEAIAKDPLETGFRVMLASVCLRVIHRGDMHALDLLLNRLIGKVREEIAVSGDLTPAAQVIVMLPSNGREAKGEDT